jgi:hypothetical protein
LHVVAARYGLGLRWTAYGPNLHQTLGALASILGAIAVIIGVAAIGPEVLRRLEDVAGVGPLPVVAAVVAACLVGAVGIGRWLGDPARQMGVAARSSETAERMRREMAIGMSHSAAYEYLRRLYADAIRDANEQLAGRGWKERYEFADPPAALGAPPGYASVVMGLDRTNHLGDLLGGIAEPTIDPGLLRASANRQRLMVAWRDGQRFDAATGQDMESGSNYCLDAIRISGEGAVPSLTLDVVVGQYGEIARTCEALVNEYALTAYLLRAQVPRRLAGALDRWISEDPDILLARLPWRRRAHRAAGRSGDLLLKSNGRAVGLGISVVTVMRDEEAESMVGWFALRSDHVGTYPRSLHVVPSGNCNTHGTDTIAGDGKARAVPSWYLATVMKSEFIEEWYDDSQLARSRMPRWQRSVTERWMAKVGGTVAPTLTGISWDLLNLRPDISAMVVLDPGEASLNWEYVHEPQKFSLYAGPFPDRAGCVQSGAGAFVLAGRALQADWRWFTESHVARTRRTPRLDRLGRIASKISRGRP